VILLREDACEGISCASEEKAAVEEPAVEGLAVEEEPFFEELVIKEVIEEAVVEELAIEEWRDVVTPGLANDLFMRTRTRFLRRRCVPCVEQGTPLPRDGRL